MQVVSTNIGKRRIVSWKGKEVETGIYKNPISSGIYLQPNDVKNDDVIDRRYHGGEYKACYLYGYEQYNHWRELFPDKELPMGMFGENLTVSGLDETVLCIGSAYKIGEAIVQISEPREPCFKLGIRFEDQGVLKHFIRSTYCGTYVSVLQSGHVNAGDRFEPVEEQNGLSVSDVFELLYHDSVHPSTLEDLISDTFLNPKKREKLLSKFCKV